MTAADVSEMAGVTKHQVNVALRTGALAALTRVGSTTIIDDLAAQAWSRARGRGRRWTRDVREAALDLTSRGATTHLYGSELSRLRGALRRIDAPQFAYLAGGLGGDWARYKLFEARNVDFLYNPAQGVTIDLGVEPGHQRLARTDNLDKFETENLVSLDAEGDLGVVERAPDLRLARRWLDTYLLGTARESAAAASLIEAAAHDL